VSASLEQCGAIRVHETGTADVLRWEQIALAAPAPDEVQVRHTAVGLNYIDVYDRSGLYPLKLPAVLGREAAGVVVATGRRVRGFRAGDRVAYVDARPGTYCEVRNVAASVLVKVPKSVGDETAAAVMLKGLTAHYLLRRTYRVQRGDWIVVHAAAGGVGLLLCQWGRLLGAKVIGIVGNDSKAELARRNGCRHVLIASGTPLAPEIRRLTGGAGAAVVYDSVGKDTFMDSLDAVRPLGMLVSYGNASGPPPAISPLELSKRGSLFLTRPSLFAYIAARPALESAARELFRALGTGKVKVRIGQRYALRDAASAHRDLEARRTTGATVLLP
jgi:NADPH2:quinone reductase